MPETVQTDDAYDSPYPYSQAVKHGDTLYLAGHVPKDPETGAVVGETIEEQTAATFRNMERVLAAAGASLDDLVKVTVYLTEMDEFHRFNDAYRECVPTPRPAPTTVEVSDLALDANVEIEAVAALEE